MGTQNRDVEAFRFCLLAVMNKNSNNDISYNFNSGQIFHTFKLCVKSIFLGWHLLTDNSLYMIYMRQHIIRPTFFPSYRAKYKRAIRCPTKRPDFLQSELSSVSVWGLKGLINGTIQSELSSGFVWELKGWHQWNYPHSKLLINYCFFNLSDCRLQMWPGKIFF